MRILHDHHRPVMGNVVRLTNSCVPTVVTIVNRKQLCRRRRATANTNFVKMAYAHHLFRLTLPRSVQRTSSTPHFLGFIRTKI
ncbi:MAG: hypothetical protein ACLS6G_04040 [Christensenellales bacterium]